MLSGPSNSSNGWVNLALYKSFISCDKKLLCDKMEGGTSIGLGRHQMVVTLFSATPRWAAWKDRIENVWRKAVAKIALHTSVALVVNAKNARKTRFGFKRSKVNLNWTAFWHSHSCRIWSKSKYKSSTLYWLNLQNSQPLILQCSAAWALRVANEKTHAIAVVSALHPKNRSSKVTSEKTGDRTTSYNVHS